jgi:hypothetical protein
MGRCLKFLNLIGKLEMGEAAIVIYPVLKDILVRHAQMHNPTSHLTPEFVSAAFNIIPAGHQVLKLLCQAAMPETLKKDENKFAKLIEEHDGFAAETWRQFQAARAGVSLMVPLGRTPHSRIRKDILI